MAKEYKRYDENFKRMIVELVNNIKSVSEVSRKCGLTLSNIRQWVRLFSKVSVDNQIFDKAEFLKSKKRWLL